MAKLYITFGALRPQCLPPSTATAATGNLLAGSLNFALVGANRYGLNKVSPIVPQSWANGDRLLITIPETIRADGEDLQRVILAASATTDPTTLFPLAWWRGYDWQAAGSGFYNEVRRAVSPAPVIELFHPDHLALGGVANTPANLLTINSPRDGMLRWVVADANGGAIGRYFYYDPSSSAVPDGSLVLDAGDAQGNWLPWMIGFGVGTISDLTTAGGCWRDARSLVEGDVWFPPPRYKMDGGLSSGVMYWLVNNYTEDGDAVPIGQQVGLTVTQNGFIKSSEFHKKLRVNVLGFVRLATGEIDTTDLSFGERTYNYGEPIYTTERELPAGYAIALRISAAFREEELGGNIATGAIATTPEFLPQSGTLFQGWRLYGNLIYPVSDRRRVFPRRGAQVLVGEGAGLVERFEFDLQPSLVLPLIQTGAEFENLKITVNGNGDVFYRDIAELEPTEALRAIVAMEVGRTGRGIWSNYVAVSANGELVVTCAYPQTIDPNYPDVIAGSSLGELNAPSLVLYVQRQSTGEIREYTSNLIVLGENQTFTLDGFTGAVIASVPAGGTGLFLPGAATPTANLSGGTFPADSYRVAYAFEYTGETVTRISHAEADGCLPEFGGTVAELFALLSAIGLTVSTLAVLRTVPFGSIGDSEMRGVKDVGGVRDTYYFDLTATGVDDGSSTAEFVLPNDRTADQPGRWRSLGLLRRYQKFKLTETVPTTAANERAIWARSSDGKLVQREPNNGAVSVVGSGGGGGGSGGRGVLNSWRLG